LCFLAITPTALVGVFVSGRFLVVGDSCLVQFNHEPSSIFHLKLLTNPFF